MEDRRLRDRLTTLADEVPPQTRVPEDLVRRARRHGVLMAGVASACVILVAVALAAGVRTVLLAEPSRPAVPSPAPARPRHDLITVMIDHRGDGGTVTIDPDGDPAVRTVPAIGRWGFPIGWSADGRLLFMNRQDGGLFVLEPDDTIVQLDDRTGGFWGASWSPDGSQIVFAQEESDGISLYLIEADGSNERLLLAHDKGERLVYPSWSPNGSLIAFLRTPVFDRSYPSCDDACQRAGDRGSTLWIVGADGSNPRLLVTDPSVRDRLRAYSYNAPAWSPDGIHLAFAAYANEGPSDVQLFILDLVGQASVGQGLTQLTSEHGDALAPAWSPDGSRIAFIRRSPHRNVLTLIDADGSDERSLLYQVPPVSGASPVLWDALPT